MQGQKWGSGGGGGEGELGWGEGKGGEGELWGGVLRDPDLASVSGQLPARGLSENPDSQALAPFCWTLPPSPGRLSNNPAQQKGPRPCAGGAWAAWQETSWNEERWVVP